MKPQLTAAAFVLSFSAISSGVPASAETFFAEGVWNSEKNQFEFYDDRLNSSNPSKPYFASLSFSSNGGYNNVFNLNTNMDLYNPYAFNSDIDWETGRVGTDNRHWDEHQYYTRNEYREGAFYQKEIFDHIVTSVISWPDCHTVPSTCYYIDENHIARWHYGKETADGEIFERIVPFEFDQYTVFLSAMTVPVPENSIFDFNQSFIYYDDVYGENKNLSLSELLEIMTDAGMRPYPDSLYPYSSSKPYVFFDYSFDTSNNNFGFSSDILGISEITGLTLAYNLPAIPEPETWAMLLAGLGIVGAITRRRRAIVSA